MATTEDKKYKLSVYLIKETYTDDAKILPKISQMDSYEIKTGAVALGTLYLKANYTSVPKWAEFFSTLFNPKKIGLVTRSARAVLIANVGSRKLCLTFGHASFLIDPLAIVRNFGLRVALNTGGQSSVRAVDKTSLDAVGIQSKEQASKEVGIANFDFDYETDILKSITAKNEEGTATLSGRDSISLGAAVTLETLSDFLSELLTKYESDEYKRKFPQIDNVAEVRDKQIIEQLNAGLVQSIIAQDSRVWLAVPEVIVWEDISGFAYKTRNNPVVSPDIHLKSWCDEIAKNAAIDMEYLKKKKIYLYDVNYDLKDNWPVYHCLNAEIDLDGRKYILNDGSWYAVDSDFVAAVDDAYSSIPESAVVLPPYGLLNEPEYNSHVATTFADRFDLMDRKVIAIGGGRDSVEFCDLFTKDKKLIHVKKYGGSSVLSHLFQQGVVAGESFISDAKFRADVNNKLGDSYKLADAGARPNPAEYEVCYAIMSDVPGELRLPFFSKVVMKNALKRLQAYGYRVTKKKISIS